MRTAKKSNFRYIIELIVLFVVVFGATLSLMTFVLSKDRVTGTSMQPGLQDGDQLFSLRHKLPKRNDIVVIYAPDQVSAAYLAKHNATSADVTSKDGKLYLKGELVPLKEHELYIKRVIGVAGDHVAVKNEQLYVNGKKVKEDYLSESFSKQEVKQYADKYEMNPDTIQFTGDFDISTLASTQRDKVPANSYFVMGDNRFVSHDGRAFGFIKKANIQSVVALRYWPINKFKLY